MQPCPGNWMAILAIRVAHAFSAGIKCWHCSCNLLPLVPECIARYVFNAEKTVPRVYHVHDLAAVSTENIRCTSNHMHITIVELVHRLHGKTRGFCFFVFVRYRE